MRVIPVLLAGGNGKRLWPLSRKSYPKQFARLNGDVSLFQQSALRMISTDEITFTQPLTLTNSDFRFIVSDQLQSVGIDPGRILIEPEGKNTAPAVLAACLYALKTDPEAILLASPVDHSISNALAFHAAIKQGLAAVGEGKIVTFGVSPTRPETGYGYLRLSEVSKNIAVPLIQFVEKPDLTRAQKMMEDGSYLWNSGIFLFRASDMVDAFRAYAPHLINPVETSISEGHADFGFWRLDPNSWAKCEAISLDFAVMEKAANLMAVPFSGGWSDLGDWHSIWHEECATDDGVVARGNVTFMECKDVLLWSESPKLQLVGLGLENIVVVAMPDAVLVAHKEKTQDVKFTVDRMKSEGIPQADTAPIDHRPWGWFESLIIDKGFQVKRLHVNPGASLSLQSHKFRSEHWVVVTGVATVTLGDKVTNLTAGQSVFIPLGALHQLSNKTKEPMVLIEVQTGTYLGEDDIIRYEDKYSRC